MIYSISLRVISCLILQHNDVDKEVFTGSFKKYLINNGNANKNGLETLHIRPYSTQERHR